jgi:hypothetical protein
MTWTYLTAAVVYLTATIGVNFTPRISPARVWCHRVTVAASVVALIDACWFMDLPYARVLAVANVAIIALAVLNERMAAGNLRRARTPPPPVQS